MRTIQVPTIEGNVLNKVYTVEEFPYDTITGEIVTKKSKHTANIDYYNISASFDIESTTIEPPMDSNGKYLWIPNAFMYQWQFCINNKVIFGRYWEEFTTLLYNLRSYLELSDIKRLVIYVHSLPYEFQFMKDFIEIDSIFAKDERKPLKVVTKGIEFRDSYALSNRSLYSFCENSALCTYYKLAGDFDYRILRTPRTKLTELEEGYCYNDVRGLCQCIDSLLLEDDIVSIPLTNTGYVRRDFRKAMCRSKELRKNFLKTRLSASEYKMLRRAFRGGNTHANRFFANCIMKRVHSFDISSSYPTKIMTGLYPIGKFTPVTLDKQEKLDYYCSKYCVVMDVTFYNVDLKIGEVIPYIDLAHSRKISNYVNDNGRVLKADKLTMTLTNIDLDIIRRTYDYDGFIVENAMYARKGKLPDELRNKMMEYYADKTQLKGVSGREYDYMKSKNRLNATFGMMVTDLAHAIIEYMQDKDEWGTIEPDIDEALDDFYKSRSNFLSYQWGVFVTANAREALQEMLDVVGEDVVYVDTDSIKFINENHIKEFEYLNKIKIKEAEENDIPAYCDREKNGKIERFYLGTWDNDGEYLQFKTLGAKKYCYETKRKYKSKHTKNVRQGSKKKYNVDRRYLNKTFHITVSGMGKSKGAKAVGTIDNFNIGNTFVDIGRTTSWFNDCSPQTIEVDGEFFTSASNIGVLETTYTLGVTNEYLDVIYDNVAKQ